MNYRFEVLASNFAMRSLRIALLSNGSQSTKKSKTKPFRYTEIKKLYIEYVYYLLNIKH